ncbi:aspartate aminotransferase family protein [Nocardia sp. NPDC058519]|uniref:aspartate aminotransferase family protein n=1 Tax=unclassified Nocardia TaxID=2637762 RepID=UPI003663CFB5
MTIPSSESLMDEYDPVFHSWSAQARVDRPVIAGALGSWFWDESGRQYLDLASQLVNVNLGHQNPDLLSAVRKQSEVLCTVSPQFDNDVRTELASLIVARAPISRGRVFFTSGGAEANENAVRLARLHTGRQKTLSSYRSYHGATAGAIAMTGDPRRWPNEPTVAGSVHFTGPYLYRSPFLSCTEIEESARALHHLSETIRLEGPETIAAIIVEPVVGTNGVLVPPDGYLAGIRALCDEFGIVMIADEVMTGFGRLGEWFAVDRWGVVPDLITFAKGVNSGYVPLGGVIISEAVAESFAERAYAGGLTYSGHPLACAPGVASIEYIEREGILDKVRRDGADFLAPRLRRLADDHPVVGDIRGAGLMWAIELVRDRETRTPLVPFNATGEAASPMRELGAAIMDRGAWPFIHMNRLHIVPPLTISRDDLALGIEIVDEALSTVDRFAGQM